MTPEHPVRIEVESVSEAKTRVRPSSPPGNRFCPAPGAVGVAGGRSRGNAASGSALPGAVKGEEQLQ